MRFDQLIKFPGLRPDNIVLPVDHHLRCVDHRSPPLAGISPLPERMIRVCIFVLPANIVPVVDMQSQPYDVVPLGQIMHDPIRRRAG